MHDITKLQEILGYNFNDIRFLKLALTHKSFSRQNNERMEFVGDGILDFIIAMSLYAKYPDYDEGNLSKARGALVSEDTLAEIATKIGLGQFLLLGSGEERSGGRMRPSILADCMEAVFAAITFDSSYIQVTKVIERLYDEYLDNVELLISKDYKSILQEYVQSRKMGLPVYNLSGTDGPPHNMVFHVECTIPGLKVKVTAQGRNKKEASQIAAEKALAQIDLFKSEL